MIELNKIYQGDCLEVMKEIQDNSIDTIITDPPYGLSFMGKEWDSFGTDLKKYQEWTRRWAVEVLRVAKPGATLLCFGGTRTWHRLACGLEDAGWIIKDTLMWVYGSGFPKATDISKQIDKKLKMKREKILVPTKKGNLPEQAGKISLGATGMTDISKPQSLEVQFWNGWKSHGLKPAWEPIIMAVKPNDGSYVDNALKWGVAGLNIDGGRIGIEKVVAHHAPKGTFAGGEPDRGSDTNYYTTQGRFPANIILECTCDEVIEGKHTNPECPCYMLDKQRKKTGGGHWAKTKVSGFGKFGGGKSKYFGVGKKDGFGGASRFFYVAKASRNERNLGGVDNRHPTVKPLKLLEYLCILTKTPTGGIVLDPFAGSGTTCMAAKKTGRNYIGIELEEEYVKIAEARLKSIPDRLL